MANRRWRNALSASLLLLALGLGFGLRCWDLQYGTFTDDERHYLADVATVRFKPSASKFEELRRHMSSEMHQMSDSHSSFVGHPPLALIVMRAGYELTQDYLTGPRLANVTAGLLTVLLVALLAWRAWGSEAGAFAGAVAALVPLAVRYDRTTYLDPVFALVVTLHLAALAACRRPWGGLVLGLTLGLIVSCKTSGLLAIPATGLALALLARRRKWGWQRSGLAFGFCLTTLVVVAFAFSDPGDYLHAVLEPSDPAYQGRTVIWYLWYLVQPQSLTYLTGVLLYLLTPPVVVLAALGVCHGLKGGSSAPVWEQPVLIFLVGLLPITVLHLPGISAEHGFLVFLPGLAILAGRGLSSLEKRATVGLSLVGLVLITLPASLVYGLRWVPVPYASLLNEVDFGAGTYTLDRTLLESDERSPGYELLQPPEARSVRVEELAPPLPDELLEDYVDRLRALAAADQIPSGPDGILIREAVERVRGRPTPSR